MEWSILRMLWRIPAAGLHCINYYYQYNYWYHGLLTVSVQDSGEAIPDCVAAAQGRYSVSNGSGFGPQKRVGSVPDPAKNLTRWLLVGRTQTRTRQPAGFAGFG